MDKGSPQIFCRMKTGVVKYDDSFFYLERKGIKGLLAAKLHSKSKVDSYISIQNIQEAACHPGVTGITRPYIRLYYKKNNVKKNRLIIFPSVIEGGDIDYELFVGFLSDKKIPIKKKKIIGNSKTKD